MVAIENKERTKHDENIPIYIFTPLNPTVI